MSPAELRLKLLAEHPDCFTVSDVARWLGCVKRNVRHHAQHIPHTIVEGMTLFNRQAARQYASTHTRDPSAIGRLGVAGINVERLQRICAHYYRCQYDAAPPELLRLAKRLAGL